MAGDEARNHHWIPQCYLRSFARSPGKKAKLVVYDRKTNSVFETSTRNIAAQRDFNRIEADGYDPNHIESGYAKFEQELAPALRRMCESGEFGSPDDFNLILNLVALLAIRTPSVRENIRDFHERVIKMMMHQTVASRERYDKSFGRAVKDGFVSETNDISYERMRDFVRSEEYKITTSTTYHVETELQLVDTVLPLLGQRSWLLAKAEEHSGGFVTSDQPVVLQWTGPPPPNLFISPGFGLKNTEVLFPVSHELLLIGVFEGGEGYVSANQRQVALANSSIVWHSGRQIYSRDDKFVYLKRDGSMRRAGYLLQDLIRETQHNAAG